MHYTSEQITALIDARRFGANSDKNIDWLLTDSRSLAFPEATLFFALRSQRNDATNKWQIFTAAVCVILW